MNIELIFVSSNQDCQDSIIIFVSSMASSSQQFVTTLAVERLVSENASPRPQDFTVHSLVGWFNVKFDKEEKYSNSRTLLIVTCWYYDKNSCIKMQYLIICKLCLIKVTNKMTWREDWYFVAPCWTLRLHYIWKTCVYISKQKNKYIYMYI